MYVLGCGCDNQCLLAAAVFHFLVLEIRILLLRQVMDKVLNRGSDLQSGM